MAFDMGFNFRTTLGYVTDAAYAVFVASTHGYPHTYTNGNGLSINAGWNPVTGVFDVNRASGNDPRIAGINYMSAAAVGNPFQIDLASGSAPGAGTYTLDMAMGDAGGSQTETYKVLDNTTVVLDATNGGTSFATASGHFISAALADVAATTTWIGATVSKVFATTTAKIAPNPNGIGLGGKACCLAHFRMTLATVAAASLLPRSNPYTHMLVR